MKIVNNTGIDLKELENKISEFYPYSKKTLGFDRDPSSINLVSDPQNATNILGKTAFYNPGDSSITVYTDNRHPKDILRSISHELVHHTQNCRGEFSEIQELDQNYAQNNKKLREMEQEAYLMGNMTFRDWEDGVKSNTNEEITMKNEYNKKKIKEMMNTIITKVKQELAEAEKPDFLDVDKDGDKEEPMSKAADKKKDDGEEKSDKDMSKVPPQLRKHVAKKMDESESVEESSCGGDHKREEDELDEGCCGKCGQSDCGCGNKMYEEDEGMEGFLSERRNNLFGKLVNEWFSAEKK
jgi:hypothetical protein